jgi:hypothetical protein
VAHERAAARFDEGGLGELAGRERERARRERDDAVSERELACLRHDWIVRAAARGARERCSDRRLL